MTLNKTTYLLMLLTAMISLSALKPSSDKLYCYTINADYITKDDSTNTRPFLLKNDGTYIYESLESVPRGFPLRDILHTDKGGQYKIVDVKAIQYASRFYRFIKSRGDYYFAKRIVHGRLNIYYRAAHNFTPCRKVVIIILKLGRMENLRSLIVLMI